MIVTVIKLFIKTPCTTKIVDSNEKDNEQKVW